MFFDWPAVSAEQVGQRMSGSRQASATPRQKLREVLHKENWHRRVPFGAPGPSLGFKDSSEVLARVFPRRPPAGDRSALRVSGMPSGAAHTALPRSAYHVVSPVAS